MPTLLKTYCKGLPIEAGPAPTLLYFAIGGQESLDLEPFCQPVNYFLEKGGRAISFDIPYHGDGYDKNEAMHHWRKAMIEHPDFVEIFLENCKYTLENTPNLQPLGVAGLSRGGFLAVHLASRMKHLQDIVTYAPLTQLDALQDLHTVPQEVIQKWSLLSCIDKLVDKRMLCCIGSDDLRVSTDACYKFFRESVLKSKEQGVRSPQMEMRITPSAGFKGHGTLPPVFRGGIDWLRSMWEEKPEF